MEEARIAVRVGGDYACFSRPEFKVERVSYPVITPSAARGVLEAIFWKPEIRYEIRRIGVLSLGSQAVIVRNEVSDRQGTQPIAIQDKRQQRSSLVLKDVRYLIEAVMVRRPHAADPMAKYLDQFERRLRRGQCHHTPYLGTREFAADFAPAEGAQPEDVTMRIGTMLFDIAFVESRTRNDLLFRVPDRDQPVGGYAHALFMDAAIDRGWLTVPNDKYRELYRLEGRGVS
jgi:CRISPR-associated protein Cas5d